MARTLDANGVDLTLIGFEFDQGTGTFFGTAANDHWKFMTAGFGRENAIFMGMARQQQVHFILVEQGRKQFPAMHGTMPVT